MPVRTSQPSTGWTPFAGNVDREGVVDLSGQLGAVPEVVYFEERGTIRATRGVDELDMLLVKTARIVVK